MDTLYDRDFYARANEQAALLRAGKLDQAAIAGESMGRSEKRELVNRLAVLLLHLLKWQFQPGLRGNPWRLSIREQRYRLESHLEDKLSLNSRLDDAIPEAYRLSRIEAERETGLSGATFPAVCPYLFAQVLDHEFWPE
jgi:hypothetical protein